MTASRRLRTLFTLILILLSAAVLCWGLVPLGRESASILIGPQEMQLPTPNSFLINRFM